MDERSELVSVTGAKRRAWRRLVLGNAQMFFAVVTIITVVLTGLNVYTIALAILTTILMVTSVVLYRDFLGLRRKSR